MPQPIPTQLGTFTSTGAGTPREGRSGDHTFAASLTGSGSVSATVLIEVSNDLVGWSTLATLTLAGTGAASAQSAQTSSHRFWRANVTALTGTSLAVTAATEEGAAGGQFSASEAALLRGVVSDARITTWANRAALVTAGLTSAFFTDVGPGGSHWDYVGGRWRLSARNGLLYTPSTMSSNNGTTKVVLDYARVPAALWQDNDSLEIEYLKEMVGASGACVDTTDICLGTVATTPGTSLGLNTSGLSNTNTTLAPAPIKIRRESATSVRRCSVVGSVGAGAISGNNNPVTVPNMDSQDTFLQITSALDTAAVSAVAWLRYMSVILRTGA